MDDKTIDAIVERVKREGCVSVDASGEIAITGALWQYQDMQGRQWTMRKMSFSDCDLFVAWNAEMTCCATADEQAKLELFLDGATEDQISAHSRRR